MGRPRWRPMLRYVAELHARSVHPPSPPFSHSWEEIGPGYCYGPAFGHQDLIYQIIDVLPAEPEHAREQILNNLENQQPDGLVPGSIWVREDGPKWSTTVGNPPMWPIAVKAYASLVGSDELIRTCFEPLMRQIGWFEANRKADDEGYYYTDILTHQWESGTDEGVRFDDVPPGKLACIDATSHLYMLYDIASHWALWMDEPVRALMERARVLREFIQRHMWCEEQNAFFDIWSVRQPQYQRLTFEGFFPLIVGAALPEQANQVIDEHILNPDEFMGAHPIASVAMNDPHFELRMWRGPTWNSISYLTARACLRYGRNDAAKMILTRALNSASSVFERTGTIWEFYHPQGGDPETLARKPQTGINTPCKDYLGHNPLIAMARLWEVC